MITRQMRARRREAPRSLSRRSTRQDSWANIVTGLLTRRDKRIGGVHVIDLVTDIQARDMWRGDDISKRVIEVLPREALRRGYELKIASDDGNTDKEKSEAVTSALEELGVDQAVVKAAQYERAYGGSAIFPVMEGALGDLGSPLDEDATILSIKALHILEPRELYPVQWYSDINDPKFGRPSIYRCIPLFAGGVMGTPMTYIHESRLIVLRGIQVTRLPMPGTLLGWGDNVLTAMYRVLDDYGQTWGTVAALLQDFAQAVLQIEGLDQLKDNQRGRTAQRYLERIDQLRSAFRAVVLDKKDSFTRVQTPLTNLSDILDRFATRLAAAADMPITLLMGMSPAGLNATGESDRAFFYDRVSALQHYLTPFIERLIRFIMCSTEGPCEGIEPDVWSIDWKPLWAPTEDEVAKTRYTNAQGDALGVQWGWLTPEEVRSRYKGDKYSNDIQLDEDAWNAQQEAQLAANTITPEDQAALGYGNVNPQDVGDSTAPNTETGVEPRDEEITGKKTVGGKSSAGPAGSTETPDERKQATVETSAPSALAKGQMTAGIDEPDPTTKSKGDAKPKSYAEAHPKPQTPKTPNAPLPPANAGPGKKVVQVKAHARTVSTGNGMPQGPASDETPPSVATKSKRDDELKEIGEAWHVYSEDGKKHLGGPYKTKQEALDRLKEIEGHKGD